MITLNRQHLERGLEFAAGVLIAAARGGFNPFAVHLARILNAAELLERLSAMEVRGGIAGVVLQQNAVFGDGLFQISVVECSIARP